MAVAGGTKWSMIRPFLVLFLLHTLAIYFFTRGFLLTRTELDSFSHCSDLAQSPCSLPFPNSPSDAPVKSNFTAGERPKDRGCWTTPSVDRLVIIVLDALRFDFVAPSTFFKDKKPWMDKLRVLQKLASEEGLSARIFKAIADPPTTSLQRLKGLTTGGLPTFIDVGNSFGAPAIVEDNLMHQLVKNGKRVLMMGDDTWMQLFPDHFNISYPYPSFDVKDLDTVDNGVIEHLIPSLYKEDWDVLIAHFLGVDHAGHIFGVESEQMINKLEQYNRILEEVVNVLKNQSGAGSLHENTFLIVMGDHGQTTNGDHGGGTAEEVETSVFAMSLKSSPTSISSVLDSDFCHPDLYGKRLCIGIFEQLDFAVTISALLGLPFPFGSIGHVDAELYALSARTWESEGTNTDGCEVLSDLAAWKQNYLKALCINSWQVQRYIDLYSTTSVIGLPLEDLYHVAQLYSEAQSSWSDTMNISCLHGDMGNNILDSLDSSFQQQIDAYSNYLRSVSKLARSAWTEFDLSFMGVGFIFMLISLGFHLVSIRRLSMLCQPYYGGMDVFGIRFSLVSAFLLVAIRAASFLSNSYILAEGRVASFLLSTAGILRLWCSISNWKFPTYELLLLFLNTIIRHGIVAGMLKETSGSTSLFTFYKFIFHTDEKDPMLIVLTYSLPIISLSILAIMISRFLSATSSRMCYRYILFIGTICSYVLISLHWVSEGGLMPSFTFLQYIGKNLAPRLVYAIGFGLLVPSVLSQFLVNGMKKSTENLSISALGLVSSWSSTIIILLGKQGPFAVLIFVSGAWCIVRSSRLESKRRDLGVLIIDPTTVIQWSLLAVCLFFYTGHWCAFDGLRYGAAFIGFDHFNIIRQGFLLAIDTFGVSHILPILGIPFIVILKLQNSNKRVSVDNIFLSLTQVFLIYGLITSTTTTLTIVCVAIQRRHLMVWGLFAPKYVFDAIGLLLTDVLILMASLYYY
ncbi:GPI ethanolamine phosphate transferase 3-like isoform X1 [Zingiber officinale]|uniref:GPI ethanolamine phosphate transferase 3-like isoform X1 n=3 Tax=Zingiber officinale TaxID=94328 RepID=UPI001C4B2D36|nr:GPI ethanolamine phosphate transferase 3-like isoform X1 [Zingiber officinale]